MGTFVNDSVAILSHPSGDSIMSVSQFKVRVGIPLFPTVVVLAIVAMGQNAGCVAPVALSFGAESNRFHLHFDPSESSH